MNKSFGADHSIQDPRTFTHHDATLGAALPLSGGYQYGPSDIDDQSKVGICTADSMAQNASKALGFKVSADFQYLLQKLYIDKNWTEGSSILSALKVGNKYGFLKASDWTHTNQADRDAGYDTYIKKLKAVPYVEIDRLLALCTNKFAGYAQITDLSTTGLAKAITESKSGILCRYNVGKEWYTAPDGTVSYNPLLIDPIRSPKVIIDGHAINANYFDFANHPDALEHANTWNTDWCLVGNCHIVNGNYAPTEAWIPYYNTIPPTTTTKYHFTQHMYFGLTNDDIKALQAVLGISQTGFYWFQTVAAVNAYQHHYGLSNGSKGFVVQADMIAKLNSTS